MKTLLLVVCAFVLLVNVRTEQETRNEIRVQTECDHSMFNEAQMHDQHHYQSMYINQLTWVLYEEQNAICIDWLAPSSKIPILRIH